MTTTIGFALILFIGVGGIYLYYKVARLDREIARQKEGAHPEGEDESS